LTQSKRRSLTPIEPPATTPPGVHAARRGCARLEVGHRVSLRAAAGGGGTPPNNATGGGGAPPNNGTARALEGWALNVSRGGVRVILEEKVDLGAEFLVVLTPATRAEGAAPPTGRVGRIVWVQEEPDGVVAGIEYVAKTPHASC
jgi:hypothetical protein